MCWVFSKKHSMYVPKKEGRRRGGCGGGGWWTSKEVVSRHLTDDELRDLFKKHDSNGDGHLDKAELTAAFKELGSHIPGLRAGQAIHQNDLDLDGDIDYHEIEHLISYVHSIGF